jgi:hypothetical protein
LLPDNATASSYIHLINVAVTELVLYDIFLLFRQAVELATKDDKEFEHLCVYVAQDCAGTSCLLDRST